MWLGEQITDRGIGNGMSLLIFAGIVVGFPGGMIEVVEKVSTGTLHLLETLLLVGMMVAVIGAIVFVERGQRRIPVQYAKRVVGRRMYQGQSTHLPLRVNTGGVIPVIFASSIIALPQTFGSMFPESVWMTNIAQQLAWGMPLYTLIYVAGIIFFCYFYTAIIFNPDDVSDNLRKYGGYVPGIRPGKRTAEYIDSILTRLTFGGALYLAAVSVLPEFLLAGFKVGAIPVIGPFLDQALPAFVTEGLHVTFYFGGTSLLIVVAVAMDTVQQIESQLIMRHYDGFLKRGRVRGRRG
jgi:preprotein translocase subunit SecY